MTQHETAKSKIIPTTTLLNAKLQEKPTARLFPFTPDKIQPPASNIIRSFATASWQQPSTQTDRARILSVSLRRERTKEEQDRVRQLRLRWKQGALTSADKRLTKSLTGIFDYVLQKRTTRLSKRETSRVRQSLIPTVNDQSSVKFPGAGFANRGADNLLREQFTRKAPSASYNPATLEPVSAVQHITTPLPGNVEVAVGRAIIHKYFERRVQDLRLFTRARRLPSHKTVSFRDMRKLKRRQNNSLLASVFCLPDGTNYTSPKAGGWLSGNETFLRAWAEGRRSQQATAFGEFLHGPKTHTQNPMFLVDSMPVHIDNPQNFSQKHTRAVEPPPAALTPLHFNNHAFTLPTVETTTSQPSQQSRKQSAYQLLAKFSDSVTSLYPQLISSLTGNELSNSTASYNNGVRALKSCYWSLRLYSQFRSLWHQPQPVDNRSMSRRLLLQTEVADTAKAQYSPVPFTRVGRFRFQNHKLPRLAPFRKVVLDWYHKFLPQYYTLLQEDAEKYQALELSPVKIQRAHPCPRAIVEWDTRTIGAVSEKKYERLTSSTVPWTAPRFENMLLTTHRVAAYPEARNALTARTVLPGRTPSVKQNFFRRAFSMQNTAYENTKNQKTNTMKQAAAVKFKTTTTSLLSPWMKIPNAHFQFHSVKTPKSRFFSVCSNPTSTVAAEKARADWYAAQRKIRYQLAYLRKTFAEFRKIANTLKNIIEAFPTIAANVSTSPNEKLRSNIAKMHDTLVNVQAWKNKFKVAYAEIQIEIINAPASVQLFYINSQRLVSELQEVVLKIQNTSTLVNDTNATVQKWKDKVRAIEHELKYEKEHKWFQNSCEALRELLVINNSAEDRYHHLVSQVQSSCGTVEYPATKQEKSQVTLSETQKNAAKLRAEIVRLEDVWQRRGTAVDDLGNGTFGWEFKAEEYGSIGVEWTALNWKICKVDTKVDHAFDIVQDRWADVNEVVTHRAITAFKNAVAQLQRSLVEEDRVLIKMCLVYEKLLDTIIKTKAKEQNMSTAKQKAIINKETEAVFIQKSLVFRRSVAIKLQRIATKIQNTIVEIQKIAAKPVKMIPRPPTMPRGQKRAFSTWVISQQKHNFVNTSMPQTLSTKFNDIQADASYIWAKNFSTCFKFYNVKRLFSSRPQAPVSNGLQQAQNILYCTQSRSQHLVQDKPTVFLLENKKEDGRPKLQRASHALILAKSAYAHHHDNNLERYGHFIRRQESRAIFDARRQRTWRDLTSFRSEKFHVVRQWFKLNNASLKSKSWAYAGKQRAVSDGQFKAARIRLRKLIWHESDEHFKNDKLRHAFSFHPKEYRANPWFEALALRRALYNYQRLEYRRYQLPQDYRSNRWMQTCRKFLFKNKASHIYIRARSWPKLQRYSQNLQRSLFHWRDSKAGVKHVERSAKQRPVTTGLQTLLRGCVDRLDVSLQQWHIAPTTFWARKMSEFGVVLVNGKPVFNSKHRLHTGDMITFLWGKIKKIQVLFTSPLKRYDKDRPLWNTTMTFPANVEYYAGICTAKLLGLPARDDMQENERVSERLIWHDIPDAGVGRC